MSACPQGFHKNLRLRSAGEFDHVFANPRRSANRCFTVLVRQNDRAYPRLGLIISKRCAKSSVQRNRLKRLIRESFRHNQQDLSSVDVVVIGKNSAVEKSNQELLALLNRQWKELQRCEKS